jgi:hypothetical protein
MQVCPFRLVNERYGVTEPDRWIGSVRVSGHEQCSFSELQKSPTCDEHASTLESAGVFPPRTF